MQQGIQRSSYQPLAFKIPRTTLHFVLEQPDGKVVLEQTSTVKREQTSAENSLTLDGDTQFFDLCAITINSRLLRKSEYSLDLDNKKLTLLDVPSNFELGVITRIDVKNNTQCQGLYVCDEVYGNLATKNETHGFSKMTFYLDRPDNRAVFTTKLEGSYKKFPHLIASGKKVGEETDIEGKRIVIWEDPQPKPSYLFAFVAGNFRAMSDRYITTDGRCIELTAYTRPEDITKAEFALSTLKNAMGFFESNYGLTHPNNSYNIFCLDKFNAGATESFGMNLFNQKCMLIGKDALDSDKDRVRTCITHELAHAWAGNMVGIRDWFHLFLKEGLASFLSEQCCRFLTSDADNCRRIDVAQTMFLGQFKEDASAQAHPVRPERINSVDNLYTHTTYSKAQEILSAIYYLLGQEKFNQGLALYFKHYENHPATLEYFLFAMSQAAGVSLSQLIHYYEQVGTPRLDIKTSYDRSSQTLDITVTQMAPTGNHQQMPLPLAIPLRMGLFDEQGSEMPIKHHGEPSPDLQLNVTKTVETFSITNVTTKPRAYSLQRDFCAPVIIDNEVNDTKALSLLVAHDSNAFARWHAGQLLFKKMIRLTMVSADSTVDLSPLCEALKIMLDDDKASPALKAKMLTPPSLKELCDEWGLEQLEAIQVALAKLSKKIGQELHDCLSNHYCKLKTHDSQSSSYQDGIRAFRNQALSLLAQCGYSVVTAEHCKQQYFNAKTMTERVGALSACQQQEAQWAALHRELSGHFIDEVCESQAVKMMLLQRNILQARSQAAVNALHATWQESFTQPNVVYAFMRSFADNLQLFHAKDGQGYQFYVQNLAEVDKHNPKVATNVADAFVGLQALPPELRPPFTKALATLYALKPSAVLQEKLRKAIARIELSDFCLALADLNASIACAYVDQCAQQCPQNLEASEALLAKLEGLEPKTTNSDLKQQCQRSTALLKARILTFDQQEGNGPIVHQAQAHRDSGADRSQPQAEPARTSTEKFEL